MVDVKTIRVNPKLHEKLERIKSTESAREGTFISLEKVIMRMCDLWERENENLTVSKSK